MKLIESTQQELFDDLEKSEPIKNNPFCTSRLGDIAEFYAVTWLWDQGYEVFLNPGSTGPIDMIAFKDGECILIDVKTMARDYRYEDGWRNVGDKRTDYQKQFGVVFLGFFPDTRKLRWINHK